MAAASCREAGPHWSSVTKQWQRISPIPSAPGRHSPPAAHLSDRHSSPDPRPDAISRNVVGADAVCRLAHFDRLASVVCRRQVPEVEVASWIRNPS